MKSEEKSDKNISYHVFFGNLANPLRVNIILSLREKGKGVTQLCKELKEEQSKISHALCALKACNIVNSKRDGKQIIYSLNKATIIPILKLIDKHSTTFCNKQCRGCLKMHEERE